jgi:hypothetical protein
VAAVAGAAVVVIVSTVLVSGGTTGFGLNVATTPAGKPEAARVTGPGKDPITIVYIAVWPGITVCEPAGAVTVKSVIVTATAPVVEARSLALPANEAEIVLAPEAWLTLAIEHVAVPLELVVPLQVCALLPLPSVKSKETPETAAPPDVCVNVADGFAALPSVNAVAPV